MRHLAILVYTVVLVPQCGLFERWRLPISTIEPQLHCSYHRGMKDLSFEWNPTKATANLKKHGISFEEAKAVFADERAKLIADPDLSDDEDRFVLLGLCAKLRLLVVCHCYHNQAENIVRIISARKATSSESKHYP
jgi:uncharacterized protein